jgi:hypothetical protein
MGPMLVATLVGAFFLFAAFSACIAVGAVVLALWLARSNRAVSLSMLGYGIVGAIAAILFGQLQRWNAVGDSIFVEPLRGYAAWAAIGFGWASIAGFVAGFVISQLRQLRQCSRGNQDEPSS